MRMLLFARRNAQEVLRDPINLVFALGFPLVLLALLSIIDASIPAEAQNTMYRIDRLAPGLAMFGTAFLALFSGMLLAKDRTSSFLLRLFASPMRSVDFLLGYAAPLAIMAAAQSAIVLLAACLAGLPLTANLLPAMLVTVLVAQVFVGLGLLCGGLLGDKAVGGICGALLTNVAAWLSGVFVPIDLIGGAFEAVAHALPFYHGVQAIAAALGGDGAGVWAHGGMVAAYAAAAFGAAVWVFRGRMRGRR